ncbi:FliH/SctL family protein [Leifsonia sp. 21MFCrub1.1]|uniref:FliH/SctL family protein n=1 Tax=Leifsonia sp. 21MFCrub1.1 TaxID=1798223 RepID=UPI0008929190|nr:FliH/SctL family protein [Leifsonia sp. 21MFCrub1.1]SEB14655.1 flagellar assembly protein FliH [Leifsonia sp. 21MFCrub1.1]
MSNDAAPAQDFAPLIVPVLTETEHERTAMTAARSRGYAAGFAEGRRAAAREQEQWADRAVAARAAESAEAAETVAVLARALRAAAVELREATVPVLADAESALVDAAFELATAVVGVALQDRVAAARAAVVRVQSAAPAGVVPVVRLHPDDIAALRAAGAATEELQLVADSALTPGDAVGELPNGWLDARIHAALDRAKEALS